MLFYEKSATDSEDKLKKAHKDLSTHVDRIHSIQESLVKKTDEFLKESNSLRDEIMKKDITIQRASTAIENIDKLLSICQNMTDTYQPNLTPHIAESQVVVRELLTTLN